MTRSPLHLGQPSGPDFVVPDTRASIPRPPAPPPPTVPRPTGQVPSRVQHTGLGDIHPRPPAVVNHAHAQTETTSPPDRHALPLRSGGVALLAVGCLLAGTIAGGTAGLIAATVYPTPAQQTSTAPGGVDARAGAATLLPSVVQIRTGQARGSGFVFDDEGHVLTNHHVIAGAGRVEVQLADGRTVTGRVVGSDPATDIAVIALPGYAPPPADLGVSASLQIGQPVIAAGSPLGLSSTVTAGIVSAVDRPAQLRGPGQLQAPMIQTDAPINPGNSGGPLADLTGRVVGVNTAIATVGGAESGNIGIGFAVPIDRAVRTATRIIANG